MTSHQKELVRKTFAMVEHKGATVAAHFYKELFRLDPTIRPALRADIEEQGQRLMQTLRFAVTSLDQPHAMIPALQAMGQRQVRYGVRTEHYATVGAALLRTLEKDLGKAFKPEVRTAWANVYSFMANTMKSAAAELELETEAAMAAR
jgi:methyl-accepting chemotaxis protein/nitric oxide dioxygenase